MNPLFPLRLRGAESRRRGKRLVGPVDLDLAGGGPCLILGPNGAGKTSLLRLIHGAARLSGGEIRWACPQDEARRAQAFVFQKPILLRRSVRDNLAYPLRCRGQSRQAAHAAAEDWAGRVGLADMLARPATALSGGEQQKLAIARALTTAPRLLFLDEPCASLDGRATREIEAILRTASESGTKLVMSTHDLGQARRLASEILFMAGGRLVEHRPATDFFERPDTAQARAFLNGDIVE